MHKGLLTAMAATALLSAGAEEITITQFPFSATMAIAEAPQLGQPTQCIDYLSLPLGPREARDNHPNSPGGDKCLQIVGLDIDALRYAEAKISIDGPEKYSLWVNGECVMKEPKSEGCTLKMRPGTYALELRYIEEPGQKCEPALTVKTSADGALRLANEGKRMLALDDILYGTRIDNATISPSGNYILESLSDTDSKGAARHWQTLYDLKKGAKRTIKERADWMPKSELLYAVREDYEHGRHIVTIDPASGGENVLMSKIPEGDFQILPTEDKLLYTLIREGKKADPDAYQIIEPDDRQPGWRDRRYPALYDGKILRPLTQGDENLSVMDVNADGTKALLMGSHSGFGVGKPGQPVLRPSTLFSLILLDLNTLETDTLVADDGFLDSAVFSPDGKKALVKGSPEAFGRIGCVLPASATPSMYQYELFIVDLDSKEATPISREFDPNPQSFAWSKYDGKIYLRAEKRDMYALYACDPATATFTELDIPENIIKGFDLAQTGPAMAVWGQSDSNPDRLYALGGKKLAPRMLDNPSAERLKNARLAKCADYNVATSRGDTIYGRFYLPDDFDPAKKYPLIVNYYGGCSPSQRLFESRYPWHLYAQMGYAVYVINPSGATGFGQEFSSRHVGTAGKGVAEDIIECSKQFLADHPYIDASKVGCIGASYGGFITMYLQTVTDMFAAAISHAGISDHASYWGEGYWGYSYSETSMGRHLPWTNPALYVEQSPLYRAGKVKTPILFLHGDKDANVPPGESIQMFTALKLLGIPAALVEISGQDHHIQDFAKRQKWQDTIFAWFAKHLQDDPSWWEAMGYK